MLAGTIANSMGNPDAPTAASETRSSPAPLVGELRKLHSARVQAYKEFEAGFEGFIIGKVSEEDYAPLINDTTIQFADLSREINVVARNLRAAGRDDLAQLVTELQSLEKRRLEKTVQYQVGQSETVFGTRDYTDEVADLKVECAKVTAEVADKWDDIRAEMADMAQEA
ncbi:hypothetical protein HKX48_006488 [Thoreauomyces humboldtii]|nr:hypothetical protein HKX48_006488 [Thoreauomyces humboldtii]